MICPNCGANVPENFTFCTYCGTPVQQADPYGDPPRYAQPQWQEQPAQQWEQNLWQQEQPAQQWSQPQWQQEPPTQQWNQPQWQQPVQQWDQNQWPQEQWNQAPWPQTAEKPRKRGKIGLIAAIAAVVLAVVILGAALLLTGGGADAARESAGELLSTFLVERDADVLMERSVSCVEEELEEDLRWSYEEVLLLLDSREVEIQTSGLASENRYEEGSKKYAQYLKRLEQRCGFEDDVKAFCEYTFTVEYSSVDTDSGEAAVTVCMAQVGGDWLLAAIDAEALLYAIAVDSTK